MKTKTHHTQETMLSNVSIDTKLEIKRETIWRKIRSKGWKISDKSIENLQRSIGRFENKFGDK